MLTPNISIEQINHISKIQMTFNIFTKQQLELIIQVSQQQINKPLKTAQFQILINTFNKLFRLDLFIITFCVIHMNSLLQRSLFRYSKLSSQFQIIKSRYLVPVKPKRPLSGYIRFCNENRAKHQGPVTQIAKKLGQEWKTLTEQQKKKYSDQSQKQMQKYQTQIKQFQDKYVTPFKKISLNNLAMKKIGEGQKISSIAQARQKLKQYLSKISPQDKKILQQQLQNIKQKRQKTLQKHHIPEPEYKSVRSFMMRQAGDKKLSELTEANKAKLQQKYPQYLQKYQKTVTAFAAKYDLSHEEFMEIVKKHQRKLKREQVSVHTMDILEGSNVDKKKPAKKKVSTTATKKKASTTTTATKKTATRGTRTTAPKKTTGKKPASEEATSTPTQ